MTTAATAGTARASRCQIDVEAVLFDLDGVLVDSTRSVERIWRRFATRHGLDGDELLRDLHGRRMIDILTAALPHLDAEQLAAEASRIDAAEAGDATSSEVLEGARELTHELTARGVPWAVATSGTDAVAAARMAAVGLAPPAVLVTADHVSVGKPDPEPYLTAADRLAVDPARCLVLEDAPSGIRAGNAAGATTVAVMTSHVPSALHEADHLVGSVRDVEVMHAHPGGVAVRLGCRLHAS